MGSPFVVLAYQNDHNPALHYQKHQCTIRESRYTSLCAWKMQHYWHSGYWSSTASALHLPAAYVLWSRRIRHQRLPAH